MCAVEEVSIVPLLTLVGMAGELYLDAPEYDISPTGWTLVS